MATLPSEVQVGHDDVFVQLKQLEGNPAEVLVAHQFDLQVVQLPCTHVARLAEERIKL